MTKTLPIRHPAHPSEEGYILVVVIFMVALLTISLAVALPKVAKEIQRDRELETMQRGKQYARAVKMYYKKFNAYPPNVDALVKGTNNIRFLRKKYVDPTTGKEEWKQIHFGQAKTQTLGFFGQPIAGAGSAGGTVMAGVGPSGGNGLAGASPIGGSSAFGSGSSGTGPGSGTGTGPGSGTGIGPGGSTGTPGGTTDPSTGLDSGGQTFGGVGIIGFSPNSPKQSILVFKKKNHYNEWEFIYDPLTDMTTMGGNTGMIGQPAGGMSGSSPIGGNPGTGGPPVLTPPVPQPTPQPPPPI